MVARKLHAGGSGLSPHGESGLKLIYTEKLGEQDLSLPAWGEWIEMKQRLPNALPLHSLSPHGESGLKLVSTRRIERFRSLSPHGESGLKFGERNHAGAAARLSPHGESGLKLVLIQLRAVRQVSLPAWGEWIEMYMTAQVTALRSGSLPAWGEWIEIPQT